MISQVSLLNGVWNLALVLAFGSLVALAVLIVRRQLSSRRDRMLAFFNGLLEQNAF